jgi:hypothetical protein
MNIDVNTITVKTPVNINRMPEALFFVHLYGLMYDVLSPLPIPRNLEAHSLHFPT